jgi:hypothetical protein
MSIGPSWAVHLVLLCSSQHGVANWKIDYVIKGPHADVHKTYMHSCTTQFPIGLSYISLWHKRGSMLILRNISPPKIGTYDLASNVNGIP